MKGRRETRNGDGLWKRIGLGVGVAMLAMLTLTALGAWAMERELMGMEWTNYAAAGILLVSSFLGAAAARVGAESWLEPVACAGGLWLCLLLTNLLGFGGDLKGASAVALAILGGAGCAMLPGRGGKRRASSRRKRRNR